MGIASHLDETCFGVRTRKTEIGNRPTVDSELRDINDLAPIVRIEPRIELDLYCSVEVGVEVILGEAGGAPDLGGPFSARELAVSVYRAMHCLTLPRHSKSSAQTT